MKKSMSGFVVTYHPSSDPPSSDNSAASDRPDLGIEISHAGVECITTDQNHTALIDGYGIGISSERLVAALESQDDAFLSRLHGNYCVLIIHQSGDMLGFCDRFGAKTLFWQCTQSHGIVISSRWGSMPVLDRQWDDLGLAETLRYRWMSGQQTLVAGISKLPHWRRVLFARNGEISVHDTDQQPHWPTNFRAVSFADKLDETRSALTDALSDIAQSYDRAAIFLSGGVDSSLLAALSRSCFKQCLLVTPVFAGESNHELAAAKSIAETLQLEHLLVDFNPARLEKNLRELIYAKGGQINFHSLAVHQMIEAIPNEYQVLIYGEAADALFGSSKFKRAETYLRWKRYSDLLPTFVSEWMSKLPIKRVKALCRLIQASDLDVTLRHLQIPYDSASMAIIHSLYNVQLNEIYAHQAIVRYLSKRDSPLRALLQDLNFKSDSANHFREAGLSATRFGKHIFLPFMAEPVVNAAKTLTREQYFGGDDVKPILRELACEYFERELIYRKKHGFAVPFQSWLKGPLAHLVEAARQERNLFDGRLLSDLDVENHYSLLWTLINWQLVNDQITVNLQLR